MWFNFLNNIMGRNYSIERLQYNFYILDELTKPLVIHNNGGGCNIPVYLVFKRHHNPPVGLQVQNTENIQWNTTYNTVK